MKQKLIILDEEQKKAVYAPVDQSILVVAPPGCGKTLLMAKRIEYLIKIGAVVPPFKILGLTFTNAAANEMQDRVTEEVPEAENIVYITNFHSYSYSVLRAYGNAIGISRKFTVLGEIEKEDFLLRIFSKYDRSIKDIMDSPPENRWTQLQNNEIWIRYKDWNIENTLKRNETYADGEYDELFQEVLREFRIELNNNEFLDFDHLLWHCYEVLKSNSSILEYYQAPFKYVLVDEFQDTNSLQFRILSLLTSDEVPSVKYPPAKVFILADPDQAIYEFQGATPENIRIAEKIFKCKVIELYRDYRFSSEGIKLLKSAISAYLRKGHFNDIYTNSIVDKPIFTAFSNIEEEAQYVLEKVKEFQKNIPLHEIAIIAFPQYRLNEVLKILDEENIDNIFVPDFRASNIERNYRKLFKSLSNEIKKRNSGYLHSLFEEVCEKEGFDIESDEVLKVLLKLSNGYDRSQFKSKSLWEKNQLFINEILLEINWGEVLRERVRNKIFLSTIHGVKGLQFEVIIICGLEQYSFPNWRICNPCYRNTVNLDYLKRELLKNLKIFYVGISRAKRHLCMTSSLRSNYGHHRPITCILKPFTEMLNVNLNNGSFCSNSSIFR
ncbi:MAG: ATP-dependent helicase [Candidatus Heimdallarchaeaceae archaeon]